MSIGRNYNLSPEDRATKLRWMLTVAVVYFALATGVIGSAAITVMLNRTAPTVTAAIPGPQSL